MSHQAQGRVKIVQSSVSSLEMIYSWAKIEELLPEDPSLFIDLSIVWFQVDQNQAEPMLWNKEALETVTKSWLNIPANFMVDKSVQHQSFRMLASLLNLFWIQNMDIKLIRSFKSTLKKAAADIESYFIAGFLKYAVVKPATRPRMLIFNGSVRKIPDMHFACTVIIIRRSKASCEDIENFFATKNANGGLSHYFMKPNQTNKEMEEDNRKVIV